MNAPRIAIFDSGVGGLTVASAVHARLPGANLRYLGDTARLPYGTKSAHTVTRYAVQAAEALLSDGAQVDALVVACNTASSCALPMLKERYDFPVLGVIGPGARRAVAASTSGHIGVIGTERTVQSGAYEQAIAALSPDAVVHSRATPLLVGLAEEGWFDGPVAEAALEAYLVPWLQDPAIARIDTVVLGCTHYPALKTVIGRVFERLLGHSVVLVDSAEAIAEELAERLPNPNSTANGAVELFATDALARFARVGGLFFPVDRANLALIDL
ncbi:MAG: glutamate racemase [Myxococcales bacterium]|nr:glutamate racemase [Myxococcales bacterium]